MRCELSPQAEIDLREIGDSIARDNPQRTGPPALSVSCWPLSSGSAHSRRPILKKIRVAVPKVSEILCSPKDLEESI
jgi:hypothetical protein